MREGEAPRGAALELLDVVKRYGADEPAVDDVSLSVVAGEFMTLLGPSGSGKTTTLNMVAGFVAPDAGRILLDGNDIAAIPTHRRGIGMVFQQFSLFPHMTVAQNVGFPLRQRKVPKEKREALVRTALEMVRLEDYAGRKPSQLSGGQQQRVALARAVVFHPPLLLMDEPLGALDRKLREALQIEIKRIHRELGITFIFVTHDQEEALTLSDRIAVFNQGVIEQVGTPADLYERPASRFVAQFLGESNVLSGVVAGDSTNRYLECPEGRFEVAEDGAEVGTERHMVVRPECMRLISGHNDHNDHNSVRGHVEEVVYLGSLNKLLIRTPNGARLMAHGSRAEHARLDVGAPVCVAWDTSDARLVS